MLGIGGIGMSALARYFNAINVKVYGYDKTQTPLTAELESEGIAIHYEHQIEFISSCLNAEAWTYLNTCVIYTPAVGKDDPELDYFRKAEFKIFKRAEILGILSEDLFTIAVAGTHGKTTTASLITFLLKESGINCAAFLGGIMKNYNTNFILHRNKVNKNQLHDKTYPIIIEADEYDRSFLTLNPLISVITSVDADHLDIYGDYAQMIKSYEQFASKLRPGGNLIVHNRVTKIINYVGLYNAYAVEPPANYYVENLEIIEGRYYFDLIYPKGKIEKLTCGLPGLHNVENSIAAIIVALEFGISPDKIRENLANFSGVKRRFDVILRTDQTIYIDDYAHHPEELNAFIHSVRTMYPKKKLTGIFQPHLFSRTKDFVNEFAHSLDQLDECLLLDIYPAREMPMQGVTSKLILDCMRLPLKRIVSKQDVLAELESDTKEVILTMGAGNIDELIVPIKNLLLKNQVIEK